MKESVEDEAIETGVTRYFFHVSSAGSYQSDEEGVECHDLTEAERLARRSAAAIACDELESANLSTVSVFIHDEAGMLVATVPAIAAVGDSIETGEIDVRR